MGLSVGGFVLIGGIGLISLGLWKKWKKNEEDHELDEYMKWDLGKEMEPRKYSYAELANAANYFKDEQKLTQEGFGTV